MSSFSYSVDSPLSSTSVQSLAPSESPSKRPSLTRSTFEVSSGPPSSITDLRDYFQSLLALELSNLPAESPVDFSNLTDSDVLPVFLRTCASGDVKRLRWLFEVVSQHIHIDAKEDEEGVTALMLASCFGHLPVVKELIRKGASLDIQDHYGWTALTWALNTSRVEIVANLLDNGCRSTLVTQSGKSVKDFLEHAHLGHADALSSLILGNNDTRSMMSTQSSLPSNATTFNPAVNDKKVTKAVQRLLGFTPDVEPESAEPADAFHWDQCVPYEMLVVQASSLDALFKATRNAPLPKSPHLAVADVWFLAMRYWVYHTPDGVDTFLDRLLAATANPASYISGIAPSVYWMQTWYRFVHYLKRDPATSQVVNSAQLLAYTTRLQSVYAHLLATLNTHLDSFVTPMFAPAKNRRWTKLFGGSAPVAQQGPAASISPLLVFLSAYLQVLQFYQVHGSIVYQLYAHAFSYLNFKFHWLMAALPMHTRMCALNWRMAWSQLEAWAQQHAYLAPQKNAFTDTLAPLTGLLQFLHLWTHCASLEQAFDLAKALVLWKPILKRVLPNYHFEPEEPRKLLADCTAWLDMEPDTIPTEWESLKLDLPQDLGEPPSEQEWLEANETQVEVLPFLTQEWIEILQKQVP